MLEIFFLDFDFSFFRESKQENIAVGSRQNFNGKIKIKKSNLT